MIQSSVTIPSAQPQQISIGNRSFSNEEIAKLAIGIAISKKAFRPLLLNLVPQGGFTEYFAIVSVQNGRQAFTVAESIRMYFKENFGLIPVSVDGLESQSWILLDFGFVFVHVFLESTRETYKLEQLWSKAHVVFVEETSTDLLLKEIEDLVTRQASR